MTPIKRAAIYHWLLGLSMLAAVGLLRPDFRTLPLEMWLALGSLAALVAAVYGLGVEIGTEHLTFMPVTALMAYFALGLPFSLPVLIVGLALGGAALALLSGRRPAGEAALWWVRGGMVAHAIGRSGAGLLAAEVAYRALKAAPPLTAIHALPEALPVVITPAMFVIGYNLTHAISLRLRQVDIRRLYLAHRLPILGVQLLPLALAPLAALTLARLGIGAFLLLELLLLTIAAVVRGLMRAQGSLQQQVEQLQSLSALQQAIRATLDVDTLLNTLSTRAAGLLRVEHLRLLLGPPPDSEGRWAPQIMVENGHRVLSPPAGPPDGFTAWVVKEKIALLAPSVEETAQRMGIENPPAARSWLGVPLDIPNRQRGCLTIWLGRDEQPERQFTPADLELLATVAVQAEVAIENALLYREAQQRAAQLARLNQISTEMNASLSPERLLELVTASVTEVAGCHKAAIYLLEEAETSHPTLLLAKAEGFSPEHLVRSKDIAVPLSESERHKLLEEGTVVTVPNVHDERMPVSAATRLLARHEDFAAYAYLPLRAQQRLIGMLAVYYDQPHTFSRDELELLETFANQAALAVANARIYQAVDIQLARRVEQIVRMADISQRLSATLDLDVIFKLIVESAIEGCKADAGVLVISGSPELGYEDNQPHMVAWRGFDPSRMERAPHHIAEELARSPVFTAGEARIISADDPRAAGPRSQLAVPISLEGQVIGALAVESELLNAFTQEDLTFVNQLAVQAAVAIRNAQLYRRAQVVRDRLHAIIDASNDGLLMLDAKARIVMTNTRMGDFWDFARQDFSPRSPEEFLADPLSSLGEGLGYKEGELSRLIKRAIVNPNMKPQTDLYVTRARGGQRRLYVERTAMPVRDEEGKFIGLLLIFRDVTEQKELEETRQNLTSMIVHELRSPLQAVMGSMRLIGEVAPADNPLIEQATNVSQRAVKKLLNLVNNLLDLSRMERGEFVLDPTPEDAGAILRDAVEELMPLAHEIGAVVRLDVPQPSPYVRADRDMIGRVVLNLLDNALKYTEPGTLVTVEAAVRPPDEKQREPMLCVSIADRGPGIPDEYKGQIFESFAHIPGRRGHRRSTGLGLAFCRLAVESHGGRIWVEDNPGGGSVFRFTLPLAPAPQDEGKAPQKKQDGKPRRSRRPRSDAARKKAMSD